LPEIIIILLRSKLKIAKDVGISPFFLIFLILLPERTSYILIVSRVLELGCGKGEHSLAFAATNPDILYMGVDRKSQPQGVAMGQGQPQGVAPTGPG
jgi:hypothetical protein